MEFIGEENHWSLVYEEQKKIKLPRRLSLGNDDPADSHIVSGRTSCASAASFPLWAMSPGTPWARSPLRESPSQPLIYHCLASLHRREGNIFSIAVSQDMIFTGSESRRIHTWKTPDCIEMGHIKAKTGGIHALLAYDKLLFTTHSDYKIRVWDVQVNKEKFQPKKVATLPQRTRRSFFLLPGRRNIQQHKDHISCIAYNQYEKILYTGSWDKTVKAWKISKKQSCVDSFVAHEGPVNAIVINQEDGCVFTCSSDGTTKIWRRVYGESSHILTMTLKFQPSPINALALNQSSPTGDCFLYSGSSDGLINFWEKEKMSGRFNHGGFLQGHHFAVLCLSSVGELILSGSEDATIRVWRRENGNSFHSCLAVIDGHHGPVRCLVATVETQDIMTGLLVYAASLDQTFKVWRVKVSPSEKVNNSERSVSVVINKKSEIKECEMSPVLSPSWVEKKVQGLHF